MTHRPALGRDAPSGSGADALGGSSSRLVVVDALRGFAALWVCALHARQVLWVGLGAATARRESNLDLQWWLELATYPMSFGSAGVILFFVLSGFCIHRPRARGLVHEQTDLNVRSYIARRGWRIYPLFAVALLLTLVLDLGSTALAGRGAAPGDITLRTLLGNAALLQGVLVPVYGSNAPLWSLSVEFHLYLAYVGLFYLVQRVTLRQLFWLSLAVSVVSQALVSALAPQLTLFTSYLFSWVLGMLIAENQARGGTLPFPHPWVVGLLALAVGLGLLAVHQPSPAQFPLAVGFAVLLHVLVVQEEGPAPEGEPVPVQAGKSGRSWGGLVRALSWVGAFSYSLYAVHGPFLYFLRALFMNGQQAERVYVALLAVVVCTGLGWVVFQTVERWTLKLPPGAQRWLERPRRKGAVLT